MLAKNELMPSIKRSCSSHQGCQPCSYSCGSGSHSVQVFFFSGLDPVAEKLGAGSRLSLNTRIQKLKQEWNVSIQISQIYSSYNGLIRISIQFFLWVGSGLSFFPLLDWIWIRAFLTRTFNSANRTRRSIILSFNKGSKNKKCLPKFND